MKQLSDMTPMMRQYHAIKDEVPDTLLLFRLGDFYELFFEDAIVASRELQITLTARQKERGSGIPMCGVPYHAAEGYIARLLRKGHKVAICDQAEAAKKGTKLVPRKITRVVTPGTITDINLLQSGKNNFLLGFIERDGLIGTAFIDVSTGEFRVRQSDLESGLTQLLLDVEHMNPREVVFPRSGVDQLPTLDDCVKTPLDDWLFDVEPASRLLLSQFGTSNLDGFGCANKPLAIGAAGALVHYARETQKAKLEHINGFTCEESANYMILDASSIRNLELLESSSSEDHSETLLGVIDHTATGMGGRLIRNWLLRPSIDSQEITQRLDAVEDLVGSLPLLEDLRDVLDGMADIERLLTRVTIGTSGPRELVALRAGFCQLPAVLNTITKLKALRFQILAEQTDVLEDLWQLLDKSIKEEPSANINDGGVIRNGYDSILDNFRSISLDSKSHLAIIERREKDRTGIGSLKLRFNKVFGYYIEVSKANLHLVPDDYIRKQTLVGHERFITQELKEYEDKILNAEERLIAREKELFQEVLKKLVASSSRIRNSAAIIAQLDVLSTFSLVARRFSYSRPEPDRDNSLLIRNGRHPVLEALAEDHKAERFVPNDLFMDENANQIHLITGPNMGGKSTYLRQNALIIILAQMGSFVPAQTAKLPIIDRVYTRIGASDNLAKGRSTFMVEMIEAAIILNSATPKSLIILDEVGRGTATFDGLSIAWAIVEHIHTHIHAKTLFATHYHELTELEELFSGVKNFHLTLKETDDGIIFLRKVESGAANRSYGIEVARLAGLPPSVLDRAREILKKHEENEQNLSDNLSVPGKRKHRIFVNQLKLFSPTESAVRKKLLDLDLDNTKPIEALRILAELKLKAKDD